MTFITLLAGPSIRPEKILDPLKQFYNHDDFRVPEKFRGTTQERHIESVRNKC